MYAIVLKMLPNTFVKHHMDRQLCCGRMLKRGRAIQNHKLGRQYGGVFSAVLKPERVFVSVVLKGLLIVVFQCVLRKKHLNSNPHPPHWKRQADTLPIQLIYTSNKQDTCIGVWMFFFYFSVSQAGSVSMLPVFMLNKANRVLDPAPNREDIFISLSGSTPNYTFKSPRQLISSSCAGYVFSW